MRDALDTEINRVCTEGRYAQKVVERGSRQVVETL